ncbi:MAG: PH domain-containing protein [Methanomassiliicoccaceae archaeon]|nr:PH domain-containing protein [Methanomassiliicoccaceae archaeon]
MSQDKSFRPRMGYLAFSYGMMLVMGVVMVFFTLFMFSASGGGLDREIKSVMILNVLILIGLPFFFIAVFYLRIKYILKNDRLVINRYFSAKEIMYSTITKVEEVTDRSAWIINYTPSVPSSKQVWIWFTDINGKEVMENISPVEKQAFLSELRLRLPDPRMYTPGDGKRSETHDQAYRNVDPTKKRNYWLYILILMGILIMIRFI